MKNKSRVYINTSFGTYWEIFKSIFINSNEKFFIKKLQNYLKVKNILLTSQGRVAIYIIIKSLIKKNKKNFITSPYTLTEALNAVEYAGGRLVFVDINPSTGLPDEKNLKKKINKNTAGIIITHLTSNEKNIKNFLNKFKKYNILEDTAINFGAGSKKGKLGTLSNFGIYSFGTMKNLCLINGGMLYVKDKKIFEQCRKINNNFRNYPKIEFLKKTFLALIIDIVYNKYIYNFISHYILNVINFLDIQYFKKIIYPGLYPNFQKDIPDIYNYKFYSGVSKLGTNLLKKLDDEKKMRLTLVKIYEKELKTLKKLHLYKFQNHNINSFLEYPLYLKNSKDKKKLINFLFNKGFDIREKWYVDNSKFLKFKNKKIFKNAKFLEEATLCLPLNPYFKKGDIVKICKLIKEYFNVH